MEKVYLVSHVIDFPCLGRIFAAFATRKEAETLVATINSNPKQWGIEPDDEEDFVLISELVVGQVNKSGIGVF